MRRDMELIRLILLKCQDGTPNVEIEGWDDAAVRYHRKVVIDAGLAEGIVKLDYTTPTDVPVSVMLNSLTWRGHDFLEPIRSESNWVQIKRTLMSSGRELSIEMVKLAVREIVGRVGG